MGDLSGRPEDEDERIEVPAGWTFTMLFHDACVVTGVCGLVIVPLLPDDTTLFNTLDTGVELLLPLPSQSVLTGSKSRTSLILRSAALLSPSMGILSCWLLEPSREDRLARGDMEVGALPDSPMASRPLLAAAPPAARLTAPVMSGERIRFLQQPNNNMHAVGDNGH